MNIKTVKLYKEDFIPEGISSNDVTTRRYLHSITEYDRNGKVLKEESYSFDGSLEDKVENKYDEEGNLIEYVNTIQGEVADHKSWEYDENKIVREYIHYVDGSKDQVNYNYDSQGRLFSKETFDEDGELEQKVEYEYSGNSVKEITKDAEGEVTEEVFSEFDGEKTLLRSEKDYFTGEGFSVKNDYDDKGRITQTIRFDENNNIVEKVEREYDENDRVIKLKETGQVKNSEIYFNYDNNGNPVRQEEKLEDGTQLSLIEREYDDNNLHIRSAVFLNGLGERMSQNYNVFHEYEFHE